MLDALGMLKRSEYANAGDLMGLGEIDNELLGYLNSLDVVSRQKVLQKLNKRPAPSQGSRAEMEKFFPELPEHIKEGLFSGKLRLADALVYSIKPVNGAKTVKMFQSQDMKEVGLRNITNGKLPKNMAMLVSGIILQQGVAATGALTADEQKTTGFDFIDTVPALCSGEFTLKANKKQIVDSTSNFVFKTKEFTQVTKGYYKLANPRLIHDDVEIEWDIELGSVTGLDAKTVLFGALHGTVTIP
jgi:hypothetical protein